MFPLFSTSALWIFAAVLVGLSVAASYFNTPHR